MTAFIVTAPIFAVTVAEPAATPVTSPVWSTVAMELLLGVTLHATARGIVCFDPSLKVPTALSWRVEPIATPDVAGVSVIDVGEAELTIRFAVPVSAPRTASIWVAPAATPVATPFGVELDTVAAPGLVLAQVASTVRSCVVPSLNVPEAA